MTYDIHDIAKEFDRLFAHNKAIVDPAPVDWGQGTAAGHVGHDHGSGPAGLGWFAEGGNQGHGIMSIHADDVQKAGEILANMGGPVTIGDIESALTAGRVRFEKA